MRKVDDGTEIKEKKRKEKKKRKKKKIIMFIVATNVVASRPTGTPTTHVSCSGSLFRVNA